MWFKYQRIHNYSSEKIQLGQENSERQFSELENKINEQKTYFTKEIETILKIGHSGSEEIKKWDEKYNTELWK